MEFIAQHGQEALDIVEKVDRATAKNMVDALVALRNRGGRLFFIGVDGGAGHGSHAVSDFRKIAGIQAYIEPKKLAGFGSNGTS